ncbi:hypothetical protein PanWU01x14_171920, partial [Parasponia andersonii]
TAMITKRKEKSAEYSTDGEWTLFSVLLPETSCKSNGGAYTTKSSTLSGFIL